MEQKEKQYSYLMYFRRTGPLAWIAHLDLMMLFERSFRRAKLPMVWSKGYNPRPALVFALPIGVGIECERDVFSVDLTERLKVTESLPEEISRCMPAGLAVTEISENPYGRKSLMSMVTSAEYFIEGKELGKAFAGILKSKDEIIVQREHKGKIRDVNIRSMILDYNIHSNDEFTFHSCAGSSKNLRPDLVLKAIAEKLPHLKEASEDARIVRKKIILENS